ncbi:hypothetical protein SanaruYs_23730 [Chryseotalea sanaruensis]|uniref:Uncharacterized protein n=1 Tax=Chryseotalea sanaruensis TaxID=2482724 RepID=A0A401UB73_9BACT|nr:hypothetical protein [Chryseotalea sanaruensis]GCC52137.1 hypothetical protein SanaruYs_23730 [Chryseotalea sanaruensis]
MEDKISQQAISRYSQVYAHKILDRFYAQKQFIGGQEILTLSEVEQINLFVIQSLFKTWKSEIQNSRSVYFDYEAQAVLEAQQNLMNVLSRHIHVRREHLEPLVLQSVVKTLNDVLNPYDFFSKLITSNNNELHLQDFKEELKYLKLNKAPLLRLSQMLEEKKIQTISGNEAFGILDKILEDLNFTPEDIEPLLQLLSKVEPVTMEEFYEKKSKPQVKAAEVNKELNQNTNKEFKTLADDFQKINVIRESLTINQKFMFTKALFGGDFEQFSETINNLDKKNSFDAAMQYLEEHLSNWDQESEEFHEFMELIEKRFN